MQRQAQFRLLVVRLGAMGDVLHALPAITALRRAHPTWRIDWAVDPRWQPLFSSRVDREVVHESDHEIPGDIPARRASRPVVDRLHRVDTRAWKRDPLGSRTVREILDLRSDMREAEYDAVLDMQGAIRSAVVSRLSGCGRIIGQCSPREVPASLFYSERIETRSEHVIDQGCELASAIAGDLLTVVAPLLPVDEEAERWCVDFLNTKGNQPTVLINPGAGWGAKRWPTSRYRSVAEGLAAQGFSVLINAGPGEDGLASEVAECGSEMVSVVRCDLARLIALMRRVVLMIAGDTGPLHLACALGKPVIGIYGPTDPARNGPYRMPGGGKCIVLRSPEIRRDHRRLDAPEAGLLTIAPQDVMDAARSLLAENYNQML